MSEPEDFNAIAEQMMQRCDRLAALVFALTLPETDHADAD